MYRLMTVGIVLLWVSAMTALFVRDVWPAWTAQDAPPMTAAELAQVDRNQQVGIFNAAGARVGTAWNSIKTVGGNSTITGTVHIEGFGALPVLLVETSTTFDAQGELDSFNLDVFGLPMTTIKVHGERHGIYFPCEIQLGPLFRQANLDMSASRLIGDSVRPFNFLPMLEVGQSWRMQIIDPLSAAMGGGARFVPIVARVTRMETIELKDDGREVECFLVETSPGKAKAWVGRDGRVYKQQVDVPVLGTVTVWDEEYNGEARQRAWSRVHGNTAKRNDSPIERLGKPIESLKKTLSNALGGD